MTYEQFIRWIVERRKTESFRAIGASLGVDAAGAWRWMHGVYRPSPMTLRFASLLVDLPDDVTKGLPKRKRHRESTV